MDIVKFKITDEMRKPIPEEKYQLLTREELIILARNEYSIRLQLEGYVYELEQKVFEAEGKYFRVNAKLFGKSSEKSKPNHPPKNSGNPGKGREKTTKLPSERYPNANIIEKHITCEELPACKCCGEEMSDSGMTEVSEYLTVIPKKFIIVRQHRHKYRCGKCHGDIVTTPAIPRVIPGSTYSDELIADATLSKYCDLIPMERYCQMAKRQEFAGLPPQSLIGASFKLAEFVRPAYVRIRAETLCATVLLADETPHRMLEGDERTGWYLWGFLNLTSCFYECHDTRSGDVASAVLKESCCEVLLTDVYSGYAKAVREANEERQAKGLALIKKSYCNSHARRGFKTSDGEAVILEAEFMILQYKEIYMIEKSAKGLPKAELLEIRQKMRPYFEAMKKQAETQVTCFSSKSILGKAFNYFIKNYEGLTLFLTNPLIPIDNNASERMLRGPVVGRKTWYGTHSKDGAEAAAIHFTLIESCKINQLNPRTYYRELMKRIHTKQQVVTPKEFVKIAKANSPPPTLH